MLSAIQQISTVTFWSGVAAAKSFLWHCNSFGAIRVNNRFMAIKCCKPWSGSSLLFSDQDLQQQSWVSCGVVNPCAIRFFKRIVAVFFCIGWQRSSPCKFFASFFSVVGTLVRPACGRSSHGFSLLVETRDFPLSGVFWRSNCRKPWSRSLLLLSDQELQQQRVSCAVVILFARFAFTNYWWLAVASADEEEEKIVCTMQSERQGGGRTVG